MAGFCPYTEFKQAIQGYRGEVQLVKAKYFSTINDLVNSGFTPSVRAFSIDLASEVALVQLDLARERFLDTVIEILKKWEAGTTVECP